MKEDDSKETDYSTLVEDTLEYLGSLDTSITITTKGGGTIRFCGRDDPIYKTGWWVSPIKFGEHSLTQSTRPRKRPEPEEKDTKS